MRLPITVGHAGLVSAYGCQKKSDLHRFVLFEGNEMEVLKEQCAVGDR